MCYPKNDFYFRFVVDKDLPAITEIYNQSILTGVITADTELMTIHEMKHWLEKHDPIMWPAWVLCNAGNEILGYCALNCFYPRPAYNITSEISIYVRQDITGKKWGEKMIFFLEDESEKRKIKNLLAFVFESNKPAMRFFSKFGFEIQGNFPDLALMNDASYRNLIIFRKTLSS